ncbi:hypothetical protein X566_08390 [Afipia sp. P52-10]|nr:hypothetical protein [Afipia sp. P52-10]ETR79028.1 hypothetical protein X566_08390 [Afipia sp. P52-10]
MRTVIREPLATTTLSLVAENAAAAHQTAAALATHPLDLVLGPDADR